MELTPAPGITLEALQAELARLARSTAKCNDPGCGACHNFDEYKPAGPTARWVAPMSGTVVLCPTCKGPVNLSEFLSHGCGIVSRHTAGREYPSPVPFPQQNNLEAREARAAAARQPRKYWTGDVPTHCHHCTAPIRRGFADSPLPGRSAWGHLCGLCWNLHGREPGAWYERTRSGKWLKKEG